MRKLVLLLVVVCIVLSIPLITHANELVIHSLNEKNIPEIQITGKIGFDAIEFDLHILDMNGYDEDTMSVGCLYREFKSLKWKEASKRSEFISSSNDIKFSIFTNPETTYEIKFYRHVKGNVIAYITEELKIRTKVEPELIITQPSFQYLDNGMIIIYIDIIQFDGRCDDAYFWVKVAEDHEFVRVVGNYFNNTDDYKIHSDYPCGIIVLDNLPKSKELCLDIYIETAGTTIILDEYCLNTKD